jgi:ribosome recycling factor
MSSLFRHPTLRLSIAQTISRPTPLTSLLTTTPRRAYASKKAKPKTAKHSQSGGGGHNANEVDSASKRAPIATTFLTPGSQQTITDPTAREEFARADAKMAASVEWLRREVAQLEARASGRVTPQLLAPVRVLVGPSASASASASETKKTPLEELATVGVRDGSSLIVTVFDPQVSCAQFHPVFFWCWSCDVFRSPNVASL